MSKNLSLSDSGMNGLMNFISQAINRGIRESEIEFIATRAAEPSVFLLVLKRFEGLPSARNYFIYCWWKKYLQEKEAKISDSAIRACAEKSLSLIGYGEYKNEARDLVVLIATPKATVLDFLRTNGLHDQNYFLAALEFTEDGFPCLTIATILEFLQKSNCVNPDFVIAGVEFLENLAIMKYFLFSWLDKFGIDNIYEVSRLVAVIIDGKNMADEDVCLARIANAAQRYFVIRDKPTWKNLECLITASIGCDEEQRLKIVNAVASSAALLDGNINNIVDLCSTTSVFTEINLIVKFWAIHRADSLSLEDIEVLVELVGFVEEEKTILSYAEVVSILSLAFRKKLRSVDLASYSAPGLAKLARMAFGDMIGSRNEDLIISAAMKKITSIEMFIVFAKNFPWTTGTHKAVIAFCKKSGRISPDSAVKLRMLIAYEDNFGVDAKTAITLALMR